ncbi:MAG: DUF1684 domain-containing protein [Acidobacteria bacterium]|nr:MAG: DUF1684 domain-containing protein [Acidobacteriota bacterium]
MRKICILLILAAAIVAADTYTSEIEKWHGDRLQRLKRDDGWLTLVGLSWLKEGENKIGSDPSNTVVLPKEHSPAHVGSIFLEKGKVRLAPLPQSGLLIAGKPATAQVLQTDGNGTGDPTKMTLGTISFYVIQREDKLAVRVKDQQSSTRRNFTGIQSFPIDAKWKFDAKYVPYNPPKKIPIANVLGMVSDEPSPGAVVFTVHGQTYRIDALQDPGDPGLSLIFADGTTGKETYGAGRYLDTPAPANGKVVVDFNKAYNPPCAFTHFATCPLPPPQNKLQVRIEAGEKTYKESNH